MQTENTYVETDLGNIAFNPRGEYSDETSYEYLDTVSYKGGSYVCLAELAKTTSGIAPEPGKNTEHWQMLTLPGGLTSDYIAMHDDVVNKAKQIETSRATVELSQQEVEAAQADVRQMRQDTQEASQAAIVSRDSAAGYAQSAEASRTAAKESEDNINAQVVGFDTHVAEKESEAETAITEARRAAVSTVSTKQDDATQAVTDEGNKQIKNVEDAGTEQVGKVKSAGASAVSTAGAAGVSAVNAVKTQQTASIKVVADKGTQQVTAVNTAGSTQASIIETKGADQVKAIQEAGENALQNISDGVDKGLSEEGKAADAKATGEAISKLTEDTAALQKRQNVLVGSETGNPIAVDDAFAAPLCGLTVYGKSTQDGTPTPDAPVPIVNAGDSGTIVVTLSNGNDKTQTLILSTPNGLPGIPVTSGGNYTDQNGQQWVCDEVDLERGVKVQRITTIVFSDNNNFALRSTDNSTKHRFSIVTDGLKKADLTTADSRAFCSALALGSKDSTWSIPNTFTIGPDGSGANVQLYVRFENINSLDELQQYLQRTPMSLTAILVTPIETPLTPAEIAAYKAITAYAPDTVVQASDGAGVKLEYQRDVNIVIKKFEDAIASMTTT